MENRIINIAVVAEIAAALAEVKEHMVFVGGAVVSLYTDDPAADEIRPTKDVDLTLKIINLSHWEKLQDKLLKLNFSPDPFGQSICSSYKYKDISVDIMASEDGPLGSANRWYKIGFENLWKTMAKNEEISILSAPCFLATKFEAFNSRGSDYRTSHDIEDIVYIIDNRTSIVEEVKFCDTRIKSFLVAEIQKIKTKGLLIEVLLSHIHPLIIEERIPLIEEKINQILIS